jgi:hypothetical protein
MAFPSAAGWGNLQQGNFSPVIYSQKVLKIFRKASVSEDITNTDFTGEIEDFGDTVKVIKEPEITVRDYQRGAKTVTQDLVDDEVTMTVDQGSYFQFAVEDIEKRHAHVNWMALASGRGAFKLKDSFDSNILSYINGQVTTALSYGSNASPIDVGFDAGEIDPVNVLARLARLLDDNDVPDDARWLVAPPIFYEAMNQTGAKLMEVQVTGDSVTPLRSSLNNGRVGNRRIHEFQLYKSRNVPTPSGSNATQNVLAGHISSTATAQHIAKTEKLRSENFFGDLIRGLHIFGRKSFRTEALAKAWIKID